MPFRAEGSPFDLENDRAYQQWRARKLSQVPVSIEQLVVEVDHPGRLSDTELEALRTHCRHSNMVIYASAKPLEDSAAILALGQRFGLMRLDANWLADEDGVSRIAVGADALHKAYIPYTNRPIKWHTDGYYNTEEHRIRGMILHCVRSAEIGGENRLMDHEIAYILLRDANPDYIRTLQASDAMTIPEREDENGVARAAQTGPVFSVDATTGSLHMRYTARTRSIEWKQDSTTLAAVAELERILSDASSPYVYRVRLEPGMGLICNNVLHDRAGFTDNPRLPRLLYRARYYDRIAGT
ncbi:MAG: TauD/TfdA family dioxygenase [Pseudomonadota bacterium]